MLTPQEVASLSPRALKLADELRASLAPEGDAGRKLTKAEGRKIINLALALVAALVVDILD